MQCWRLTAFTATPESRLTGDVKPSVKFLLNAKGFSRFYQIVVALKTVAAPGLYSTLRPGNGCAVCHLAEIREQNLRFA